jgi:large subunit ribosomal protein L15
MELVDLSNLQPSKGARRARKRIGRGPGSGTGKTSGRGHKGKGARSGGNVAPGYEGGQMPLQRRLPKRGFKPIARRRYALVKVGQLERFEAGSVIDAEALVAARLVRGGMPVKLLADGELSKRLTIKVDRASAAARERVAAAGGTVELVGGPDAPADGAES